jgi:hypothetical protein
MSKRPALTASEVLDRQRKLYEFLGTDFASRYFDSFFTSVAEAEYKGKDWLTKAAQAVARMIHPANNPDQYIALVRKDLFSARTFQVTGEMVDAVNGLYTETRKHVSAFVPMEVPSPSGFVWFDKPPVLRDVNERLTTFRAISWGTQVVQWQHGSEGEVQTGMGVRVTLWSWTGDTDDHWTAEVRNEWLSAGDSGGANTLILLHSTVMPFGERFGGHDGATVDDFVAWVHSLWLMMDTEIVSTSRPGIRRFSMRKFQEQMSAPPEVNVIRLRRIVSGDPDAEHVPAGLVDWQFRWIVQGHLRHLDEYEGPKHHAVADAAFGNTRCAACQARVTWVKPHVKGPAGKPLRSAEQVYRLQR